MYVVDVKSLELDDVCFSLTKDFDVVPHLTSFEAVCLRLDLDPEDLWSHVKYMMNQRGISNVLQDYELSLVKEKKEPAPKTVDMFGYDFAEKRVCVQPITIEKIVEQVEAERRQRLRERQQHGTSFDDSIDDLLAFVKKSESKTSTSRKQLTEIDSVFDELGLNEAAVA